MSNRLVNDIKDDIVNSVLIPLSKPSLTYNDGANILVILSILVLELSDRIYHNCTDNNVSNSEIILLILLSMRIFIQDDCSNEETYIDGKENYNIDTNIKDDATNDGSVLVTQLLLNRIDRNTKKSSSTSIVDTSVCILLSKRTNSHDKEHYYENIIDSVLIRDKYDDKNSIDSKENNTNDDIKNNNSIYDVSIGIRSDNSFVRTIHENDNMTNVLTILSSLSKCTNNIDNNKGNDRTDDEIILIVSSNLSNRNEECVNEDSIDGIENCNHDNEKCIDYVLILLSKLLKSTNNDDDNNDANKCSYHTSTIIVKL